MNESKFHKSSAIPVGSKFHFWTVIGDAPRKFNQRHVLCRCVCGNKTEINAWCLRHNKTHSCGCQTKKKTHQKSSSTEYHLWKGMKQRCNNPKARDFKNYGGRGIRVCERWARSFEAFIADVGCRPDPKMSIDRINNNGDYEPSNVRWATRTEQNNNTRWTRERRIEHGRSNAMKRWHPESHAALTCAR